MTEGGDRRNGTMSAVRYEYSVGGGGCSRCEAMVGIYEYQPTRPHDYCDCIVTPVRTAFRWTHAITKWYWAVGESGEEYIAGVDYTVEVICPDTGELKSDSFHLAQTEEESNDASGRLFQLAYEQAHFIYQNECIGLV